jgi:hypothetical protein
VDPSDEENEKTIMFRVVWKVWPAIVGLAYFVPVPSDFGSGGRKEDGKVDVVFGKEINERWDASMLPRRSRSHVHARTPFLTSPSQQRG